jgi:hypothetical protein
VPAVAAVAATVLMAVVTVVMAAKYDKLIIYQ